MAENYPALAPWENLAPLHEVPLCEDIEDLMGFGHEPAIRAVLKQTGLSTEDIDLFEISEAFKAQEA